MPQPARPCCSSADCAESGHRTPARDAPSIEPRVGAEAESSAASVTRGRAMREVTEALLSLLQSGDDGALATVIETLGSTPQVAGARLLLCSDGRRVGTIGGGAVEQRVLEAMAELIGGTEPRLLPFDLARDLGMCCGGRMVVFVEPIRAAPRLTIFGAGHVAQPTAALAASVGFEVVVVDEREELNTPERFPGCRRELTDVASAVGVLQPSRRDWLLIVTHDHALDTEALRVALGTGARYIGLVGSRRKVYRLLQRIVARSGPVDLRRVYAPVGLALGAVSPAELAVSIVAELIALRHGGALGHSTAVDDARLRSLLSENEPGLNQQTPGGEPPDLRRSALQRSDETAGDLDAAPPLGAFDRADINGDDTP